MKFQDICLCINVILSGTYEIFLTLKIKLKRIVPNIFSIKVHFSKALGTLALTIEFF